MRWYINNFNVALQQELEANKQGAMLFLDDVSTQKITTILPNSSSESNPPHFMRLTLQPIDSSGYELIDICNMGGMLMILRAGVENTQPAAWPMGTRVLCAATAHGFKTTGNTYIINRELAMYPDWQSLTIDATNGTNQILPPATGEADSLPIVISNMHDGDEIILELGGTNDIADIPVFLNASKL